MFQTGFYQRRLCKISYHLLIDKLSMINKFSKEEVFDVCYQLYRFVNNIFHDDKNNFEVLFLPINYRLIDRN